MPGCLSCSLRSSRDREESLCPLCSCNAAGVTAVDCDRNVVLDISPFLVGRPEDLTEGPGEGCAEAEKGLDMSTALVDGFVSLH